MMAYNGHENITFIEPQDRTPDGYYEINGAWEHIHPFELLSNGQVTVPLQQLPGRESLSIRAKVTEMPLSPELFYRFHPGKGGISHIFYDKNFPEPVIDEGTPHRNQYSEIVYSPRPILVPLEPGTYYYHVLNLEGAQNVYRIGFTLGSIPVDENDPCAIFN